MMKSHSSVAKQLLELLAQQGRISTYQMAAQLQADRTTIYRALWMLQGLGHIKLAERGRGNVPNRYEVLG